MQDKKKTLIGILSVLVCVMAVGYALLAQELTINGSASIDSTWRVEITNVTQKELVGGVTEKSKSYTATTANFDIGFTQPGDYVIYDIEVTNSGTLDAVISNINVVTDNNPAIIYTTSGLKRGDKISKNGDKKNLTVKIEYDSNVTSQPVLDDNDIIIEMNYQQDLGQVPSYEAYSIGDTVEFAGSNWYVIKNSTAEEDYVTLMKERILTHSELGEYAIGNVYDTMAYYWDDNCHPKSYGYSSSTSSGCAGHNNYEGSKVKELLEGSYINTLGVNNLKEVDSYKIRLITLDELQQNLGVSTTIIDSWYDVSMENTPTWVYQNFGENPTNSWWYGYWTMTSSANHPSSAWDVRQSGRVDDTYGQNYNNIILDGGVRPVINLLKSAIE